MSKKQKPQAPKWNYQFHQWEMVDWDLAEYIQFGGWSTCVDKPEFSVCGKCSADLIEHDGDEGILVCSDPNCDFLWWEKGEETEYGIEIKRKKILRTLLSRDRKAVGKTLATVAEQGPPILGVAIPRQFLMPSADYVAENVLRQSA